MNIFHKKPTVIGMVHFSALAGTDGYENNKGVVLQRAREDIRTLQEGGVDMVMFENNFDIPKFAVLPSLVAEHFEELIQSLVPEARVPWGVSPLWNDYRFGFFLCQKYGGVAVRVPVFIDSVETVYGIFTAEPGKVLETRKEFHVEGVAILADVQVKHARMMHPRLFSESVADAMENGADGIIVTGRWTGDVPNVEQCAEARRVAGSNVAILAGSGMTEKNIISFAPYLDACIVGTAFKEGDVDITKRFGPNVVEAERRLDQQKIEQFMNTVKKFRDKKIPLC